VGLKKYGVRRWSGYICSGWEQLADSSEDESEQSASIGCMGSREQL
jgi:hypothetical protein